MKKRRLNDDTYDIKNDYLSMDLEDHKSQLYKLKAQYERKCKEIEELITLTNSYIAKKCEEENGGHKWITEREDCMYGERFTFCKDCRVDYRCRDYFHN